MRVKKSAFHLILMPLLAFVGVSERCWAQDDSDFAKPIRAEAKLLGQPIKVEQSGRFLPSALGIGMKTESTLLGHPFNLIEASIEAIPAAPADSTSLSPPPSASATPTAIEFAKSDLYIHGTRVWSGSLRYEKGGVVYSGGIAPTQIPIPLFVYPLGPLVLEVDAGVEFEGMLEAALTPGLSYPLQDSSLDARLQARLSVAAYVEGYASIWVLRGGVGGRVNLIEGTTGIAAHLYFNGQKPSGQYLGKVNLLQGSVYGFVDTNLLFGRWTRVLKKNFYHWNGLCYSFGADACALN